MFSVWEPSSKSPTAKPTSQSGIYLNQMSNIPTIWLVPRHATSFVKMFDIATALKSDGRTQPVFLFATGPVKTWTELCEQQKIQYLDVSARFVQPNWLTKAIKKANDLFENNTSILVEVLTTIFQTVQMTVQLLKEKHVFASLIKQHEPLAILVPGDRELCPIPSLLSAARASRVPTVLAAMSSPYTHGLVVSRKNFRRFFVESEQAAPLLNRLLKFLLPQLVHDTEYGRMLFSPAWLTLTLKALNMLPANPWVQGSGLCDYHLQHDEIRMEQFIALGSPSSKMIMVGDPSMDQLYKSYSQRKVTRRRLLKSYILDSNKPIVLFSVPNDAEHGVYGWNEHLTTIGTYMDILSRHPINVILSFHPKSNPKNYTTLTKKYDFKILQERLYDVLPAADLFVCSSSSTVLWAENCSVTVLNLDYLNVLDGDFLDRQAIINVQTPGDCDSALKNLFGSDKLLEKLHNNLQQTTKNKMFDGKSGKRIADFLWSLP